MSAIDPSVSGHRLSPSPLRDDDAFIQLISDRMQEPIVKRPWHCDVIRAHADLINIYNNSRPDQPLEPKFTNLTSSPRRLDDLLWDDFNWLARHWPNVQQIAPDLVIVEISGPKPNADVFILEHDGKHVFVVGFRSALVQFINATFSKMYCLTHFYRHADCLKQFDDQMNSDTYSDTSLLAGLFNDIEILFELEHTNLPFKPKHIADPYNYCERAEGARRFMLAHELSHLFYDPVRHESPYTDTLIENGLDEATAIAWHQELWCDDAAIKIIHNNYRDVELSGTALYELENALVGILKLLFLWDVIETFLRERNLTNETHPPAIVRIDHARQAIKRHPNFERCELLRTTLNRNWSCLNGFREFAGGANAPFSRPGIWSMAEFERRLSPYGREVYRAQFDVIVTRFHNRYEGDAKRKYENEHNF